MSFSLRGLNHTSRDTFLVGKLNYPLDSKPMRRLWRLSPHGKPHHHERVLQEEQGLSENSWFMAVAVTRRPKIRGHRLIAFRLIELPTPLTAA
jgi:hypothetical protein